MSTAPLPITEFAKRIRSKYPGAYDSLSDTQLVQKIVDKYPDYKEKIAGYAPTQFEKQNANMSSVDYQHSLGQYTEPERLASKVLTNAGLPDDTSKIGDFLQRAIGQEPGQPWRLGPPPEQAWFAPAVNAVKNPSQESIVNAVPFIGPTSVEMAKDFRNRDYAGVGADLTGALAPFALGPEVRPGIAAAKKEAMDAFRTPTGELRPGVKAAASVTGAGLGAFLTPAGGKPEGAIAGAYFGPKLADALVPDRAPAPNFYGGAYSDYFGEPTKAVPIRQSPFFDPQAYRAGATGLTPEQATAARNPDPFEPVIVENQAELDALNRRKAILQNEARSAGLFSAARGKVGRKLNYQERIGKDFQ